MADNLLYLFLSELNRHENSKDISALLFKYQKELNVAKVFINDEIKTFSIFDNGKAKDDTFIIESDENYIITAYKCDNSKSWDFESIKVLLRFILLQYKNDILKNKLKKTPYVQFLTGLLNTQGFNKTVNENFKKEVLINNYYVIFFNLQGFGLVNKLYSISFGDLVIKTVAKIVKSYVKASEVLGHIGGDNFIVLIEKDHFETFVKNIESFDVAIPLNDDSLKLNFKSNIGAIFIDDEYYRSDDFVSSAAAALQYAKSNKKPFILLNDEVKREISNSKKIDKTLIDEMNAGNFVVYYQPKVDIRTGAIVGAEALARWVKDGRVISPAMFIPILEKNGDIAKLDLYILEKACQDISHYKKLGNKTVPLSCNISRIDLKVPSFHKQVVDLIKKYEVDFEDMVIEVTETTNIDEKAKMVEFLDYLHKHNIKTSIDDFGIGYSSLSSLRDFNVNEIKIDRSFIDRNNLLKSDEIIVSSIIEMAKKLNIDVICEGVENDLQVDFLKSLGCFKVQGFLYDKPLPKDEFEARLKKGTYKEE